MSSLRALVTSLLVIAAGAVGAAGAADAAADAAAVPAPRAAVAAPGDVPEDQVVMKDGKVIVGRVVYDDEGIVILRTGTRDREIARSDIAELHARMDALRDLLAGIDQVQAADEDAVLTLARQADKAGLSGEAHLLELWALCQHPDSEAVNQSLGDRLTDKVWRLRRDKGWLPVRDLLALQNDWNQRWTLRTLHYELQTDIPLSDAIARAFDLERLHEEFFHLFAGILRLPDVDDVMPVQIHAKAASYPEPGDKRAGWFDPAAHTLYVQAIPGYSAILLHEGTHQLLSFTTQRTRTAKGQIPGWFDEGLAQYFESGFRDGPIGLRLVVGLPDRGKFMTHMQSNDPYELKRLLTMEASDFMSSTNTLIKYAQSYTLVHYLLQGDDGHPLKAFGRFVNLMWNGQSSMSDFKKSIDTSLEEFEKAWIAYVHMLATKG